MRRMLLASAAAAAIFVSASAQAAKIFNVNGNFSTVAGVPAGMLSGTITTSDDLSMVSAFSLTTSAITVGTQVFTATTYTNANSGYTFATLPLVNTSTLSIAMGSLTTNPKSLTLVFSALSSAGSTLSTLSTETQTRLALPPISTRIVSNGSITAAVPEPATWATMLVGFGMVGGAARYRRRRSVVSFA